MKELDDLLQKLWRDYAALNRQAQKIHQALESRGEKVINDHVAFRTFDLPDVGIKVLERPFLELGYQMKGEAYQFKEKRLIARHYEHLDAGRPKVFISALKVNEFSQRLQGVIRGLIEQLPTSFAQNRENLYAGPPWEKVTWQTYCDLLGESEYAAWMSVFGFRVNHFTVLVNSLRTFQGIEELNTFIKDLGFAMNASGGEVKGSKAVYLEQSSTLAYPVTVEFADRKETIPGCYYEFAKRYPLPDGKLFQGFIPDSADKLFESTNVRRTI